MHLFPDIYELHFANKIVRVLLVGSIIILYWDSFGAFLLEDWVDGY